MAFNHRRLITGSARIEIFETCKPFCNPLVNTGGFCPSACISWCYPTCFRPLTYLPPPAPDQSIPTSDDNQQKYQTLHLLLIFSLSILATACLVFCLFTIYKYYKNRIWISSQTRIEGTRDDFLDENQGPVLDHPFWFIRTVGLQPSVINSITVCRYKKGDGLVEGTECSVCLNEFQEDETLRLLPKCSHAFHLPCIDTWLRSHTNCPLCRAGIVSVGPATSLEMPEQGVDSSNPNEEAPAAVSETSSELEIGTEESESVENGESSRETSLEVMVDQPIRRSISMDSLSASKISVAIVNAEKLKRSKMGTEPKDVNVNRSLQIVVDSSSMSAKRSFSCSGKAFYSRYSKSAGGIP
ncbi:hypothetical protein NMG60_11021418 [Bertholletia excelsa]